MIYTTSVILLFFSHTICMQLHKPEAVVRAYRAFVESFGNNFAPPPARGEERKNRLTHEDMAQRKRSEHLSEVRLTAVHFVSYMGMCLLRP